MIILSFNEEKKSRNTCDLILFQVFFMRTIIKKQKKGDKQQPYNNDNE